MMVHNTQNYWVFGLCPSSGILKTRERNVSETRSVSILRWVGRKTPTQLGPLERATSINGWLKLALSKGPNRVSVSPLTVKGLNNLTVTGRQAESITNVRTITLITAMFELTLYGKGWVFSLARLGSVGCLSYPSQAHSGMTCVRSDQSAYLETSESKGSCPSHIRCQCWQQCNMQLNKYSLFLQQMSSSYQIFTNHLVLNFIKSYNCLKFHIRPQHSKT
jgi:hypothetical protein